MSANVEIKLLKDGSGRVCIHWFDTTPRDAMPITTPADVKLGGPLGLLRFGGVKGRIACKPELSSVTPQTIGGITYPVMHSDDVRAATCPLCLATTEAKDMLKHLGELEEAAKAP